MLNRKELHPDLPASAGMENALKRMAQLTEFRWTPTISFPAGVKDGKGSYFDNFLYPWCPQTGLPYSSVRINEKFLGFSVGFETFVSALQNPDCPMYTQPQHGMGLRMFNYYGTVCSAAVSYALDFPYRVSHGEMEKREDMHWLKDLPLNDLRLCDILLKPKKHVAMVTGIFRSESGDVEAVEVSESIMPTCLRHSFTAEEFLHYWIGDGYRIYRFDGLDHITYTPSPYVPLPGDPSGERPKEHWEILPDLGDKSNYSLGQDVGFTLFTAAKSVTVACGGKEITALPVEKNRAVLKNGKIGMYKVWAADENGKIGDCAEFCIHDSSIITDRETYREGETITVSFTASAEDTPVVWLLKNEKYGLAGEYFLSDLKPYTITAPKAGRYLATLVMKNRYGTYCSSHREIIVTP